MRTFITTIDSIKISYKHINFYHTHFHFWMEPLLNKTRTILHFKKELLSFSKRGFFKKKPLLDQKDHFEYLQVAAAFTVIVLLMHFSPSWKLKLAAMFRHQLNVQNCTHDTMHVGCTIIKDFE